MFTFKYRNFFFQFLEYQPVYLGFNAVYDQLKQIRVVVVISFIAFLFLAINVTVLARR